MRSFLPGALFTALLFTMAAALPAKRDWLDITVPIDPAKVPVYPGDAPAELRWLQSMEKGDALNLTELRMGAHTGTHIDAPLHFLKDGAPVDAIAPDKLIGPARVIECSPDAEAIDAAELARHDWRGTKRLLFKTRSSYRDFFSDKEFHKDFTYIAPDAARQLADAGVDLVGIDYLSVERFGSEQPVTHQTLLAKGIVILEGLDLRKVGGGDYELIALPLPLAGRDGAPARAVLRKK